MCDLTIIIPHFNTPAYLKTLLQSIPVRDNIQVVVVDDNSSESVNEYLALKDDNAFEHVTFLVNDTGNKGPGACRNIGLRHTEGKWVLFSDADDYFIEGFYNIVEEYFASDYDVVLFVPTSEDIDTKQPAARHLHIEKIINAYLNSPKQGNELSLRYKIVSPWSKMVSYDFIKKNDIYFNEVVIAADVAFSAKVGYYMQSFTASAETIYCITNSTGTLSKTISIENYDARLNEFIQKYVFLRERLNKKDFKFLGLCGAESLVKAVKYGFGLKKLLEVLRLFRKNKVRIISLRLLSEVSVRRAQSKNSRRFIVHQ